jgi:acyl-CoA synthetase (NDP forming)
MSKSSHPLEFLFHPRSIAIPGASTSPGPGSGFLGALILGKYKGQLYPVNPKADEIQGLKCYPRLRDVPGTVDYVISSVPAPVVPELLEDCGEKRVKAIHFFTAGFSETGNEERANLEAQIVRRTKELGIRVIGPNCMGLYCPETRLAMMPEMPKEPGPVALVSQSGANAGDFCRTGAAHGLRFSKVISYGNAADLDESDFLEYCAQDPSTEFITSYIEGVKDGQRFLRALRTAAAAKPVIILKGGRTEAGGRATVSHTGSLAGGLDIFDAACRQAGAIRVDDMEDLIDCAVAFRFLKGLPGPGVGIVGVGGGHSVLSADAVASAGLEVPPLPEETQRALAEFTPMAGTSVRNPVDTNVAFGPEGERLQAETLRLVAEAPTIDVLLLQAAVGWGPPRGAGFDPADQARRLAASTAKTMARFGKPVAFILRPALSKDATEAVFAFQEEAAARGLATFNSVPRAAQALRRVLEWQAGRA